MSATGDIPGTLDQRLRALFAGVDAAPGFEARVMARIAALHTAPDAKLFLLAERRRARARLELRREAGFRAATAAGVGVALMALVWREGPAIAHWVEHGMSVAADFGSLAGFALLALGLGAWAASARLLPR